MRWRTWADLTWKRQAVRQTERVACRTLPIFFFFFSLAKRYVGFPQRWVPNLVYWLQITLLTGAKVLAGLRAWAVVVVPWNLSWTHPWTLSVSVHVITRLTIDVSVLLKIWLSL